MYHYQRAHCWTRHIIAVIYMYVFLNDNRDPVLGAVTWITNDELCVVLLNRVQNKAVILSCNVNAGNCKIVRP